MKVKRIILIVLANLLVLVVLIRVFEQRNLRNQYGDRFRQNAFIMSDSVAVDAGIKDVYNFFIHHYHEIYAQTAKKHHVFKLMNTDSITEGTLIYCTEGNENEMVYHHYVVHKVVPKKMIYKSSEPSTVRVIRNKGIRENQCNAFVYVDFKAIEDRKTMLGFTIAIQMPNLIYATIGRIAGGRKAKEEWNNHLKEELTGFRDAYYRTINI